MYTVNESQDASDLAGHHQKPSSPMPECRTWHLDATLGTVFPDGRIDRTCCPKPFEPHAKRFLTSCYSICQFGNQKGLEFIFCVTTHERCNQASSGGTRHDTRKEVRIQERLDHPEMIYVGCESIPRTVELEVNVQYPNEAPPERQRAVAPRLVFTLR